MDKSLLNKNIVLEIIDMNDSGQGVAKKDGIVYFVNGAVIGDIVKTKIVLIKKNYSIARAIKLISPSSMRKDEFIDILEIPYGLSLRPLKYEHQLEYKEKHAYTTIDKIAKVDIEKKNSIIGLKTEERYRNKGVFPIRNVGGDIKIGAFERASHDIVEIIDNVAMPESYSVILSETKELMQKFNISAYSELKHIGGMKFVTIRSNHLGEHLIILSFNDDELQSKSCESEFAIELKKNLEKKNIRVIGIIKSIKKSKSNSPSGGILSTIDGQDYINNKIAETEFKLGSESFFQVSTEGVEKLYGEVFILAKANIIDKLDKNSIDIWDIYCGVGSIGIYLAKMINENKNKNISLKGLEFIQEATDYAKENAKINDIENTHFECGKAENLLPKWVDKFDSPDIIIVDPPRKGLDKNAIDSIIKTGVKNIIYLSCKVSTLARDLKIFNDAGYEIEETTPVDLFPMSMHCEVIAILSKK